MRNHPNLIITPIVWHRSKDWLRIRQNSDPSFGLRATDGPSMAQAKRRPLMRVVGARCVEENAPRCKIAVTWIPIGEVRDPTCTRIPHPSPAPRR